MCLLAKKSLKICILLCILGAFMASIGWNRKTLSLL